MSDFRFPRWVVVIAVAVLFLLLTIDWVRPGVETKIAVAWLQALRGAEGGDRLLFPLWGWLVGLAGKDVVALGWVSVGAGLVCVWLAASIVGMAFDTAVRLAEEGGAEGEGSYVPAENAAILLSGLAFALTPGFLVSATRVSPLMVVLLPPLAAVALAMRPRVWRLLVVLLLLGYSACELTPAWRVVWPLAVPSLAVWLVIGVMPALVIAWCVRKRWLLNRRALWGAVGGWAVAVAALGTVTFTSGVLREGRVGNGIVARIIANVEESGRSVVVSDGTLDELFYFMLPERIRLISLAYEYEPTYGRELGDWVRGFGNRSPGIVEDLVFAAELGPGVFIDEWEGRDKSGFDAMVASVMNFFTTREKWEEACGELQGMRPNEPLAGYLRRFLAVCGNALGCRMLDESGVDDAKGKSRDAWMVFKTIADRIDPENYAAYLNLQSMVRRGHAVSKSEMADLAKRRSKIEKGFKDWDEIFRAARTSGRLYVTPDDLASFERRKREMESKRKLTPEQKAFVETIAAAAKDPKRGRKAQETIHRAISRGRVRVDAIGGDLITIDLALGDAENAERDAIAVLKRNRHDPTANAALGSIAVMREDYERAERYLRRAIRTGRASAGAKNDLAWTLYRLGRLDEAESLAHDAVGMHGEMWAFRETLAAILIGRGKIDAGEQELEKAENLAKRAGVPEERTVSFMIDRARILRARGDKSGFKKVMATLRGHKGLTGAQRSEVAALSW